MRGWGLIFGVIAGCGASSHAADDAGREDAFGVREGGAFDAGFDAGPPPTPEESFRAEYARIRCEHAVRCARPELWLEPLELYCNPDYADGWLQRAPRWLEQGLLRFDETAVEECLDFYRVVTASCTFSLDMAWPSWSCGGVYVGLVPDGGVCRAMLPSVCVPGSYCDAPSYGERGTCRPQPGIDEACDFDECAGWPEVTCVDGACRLPGEAGASCRYDLDCVGDLMCDVDTCAEPYVGMPCEGPFDCAPDLGCVDRMCAMPLTEGSSCVPRQDTCEAGSTCFGEPAACTRGACTALSYYALDTCAEGEICLVDWPWYFHGEGICVPGQPVGAACNETAVLCARGARCVSGTCKRVVLPEAPCGGDAVCPIGFACVDRACVPLAAPGRRCDPAIGCLQGQCIGGVCCLGGEGTPCTSDHPSPLGACAGVCWDPVCGRASGCDESCAGQACWWPDPERCVPLCP